MGEQSASRLQGDRYQHLYSWYELLHLLDQDSPYDHGFVEQEGVGSADDVVLYTKPKTSKRTKFTQVKWHVDHREGYSLGSLTEILSGTRSLLQKLFDSWKKLSERGPIEIWLVSNWAAAPDLGSLIHARDYSLKEEFFACSPTSEVGRSLKRWIEHLSADENALKAFCRDLRLRLGFAAISDLQEMVDDRMSRYGLRIGDNPRAAAIDEISKWVEVGGESKRVTRETLIEAIRQRELWSQKSEAPSVSLWVHGWAKKTYDSKPTVELDWTEYFSRDERRIPSDDTWEKILRPELKNAKEELARLPGSSFIDFRGKVPLTVVLGIGAEFPEVAGYRFRVEQPTRGETLLWTSDAKPLNVQLQTHEEPGDPQGHDVLIVVSITGDASEDVRDFLHDHGIKFHAILYVNPPGGPGDASISSGAEASAYAIHTKELIRMLRNKYRANHIHLILYAPSSYCLFLGQRLNAVGDILTYERTSGGSYQASLTLRTG